MSVSDMDSGVGMNQRCSQDRRESTASAGVDSGFGMKQESGNTSHELRQHSPKIEIGKTLELIFVSFYYLVGNLFTTAGRKRVVIFVAGHTHNSGKGICIIFIHIIFFPLGAWQAAQELLAGC